MAEKPKGPLRRGWTTGACAAAAAKAAFTALVTGRFPDPVTIRLPRGERPAFALAYEGLGEGEACAGIVKDAGDDPDVTHGALVIARVSPGPPGSGLSFRAGKGVGTVTKPGLPIPPGEPAINPVPRRMIGEALEEVAAETGRAADLLVEISIPDGAELAARTWNPRLGIAGGLSILGTTGIVRPFSCAAWIASIHRGIDVARANGLSRVAASTGATSEAAVRRLYDLPEIACLDMGDFLGGTVKYLRRHPIPSLVIGGGFAKLVKLAQGFHDLHSGRSQVDFAWLAARLGDLGGGAEIAAEAMKANTANEVLGLAEAAGLPLAELVARLAREETLRLLEGAPVAVEVVVVRREGRIAARAS